MALFYDQDYGGKKAGRYRISDKLLRKLANRKRLYENDIQVLGRALLERGYVLIDLNTFYVVMSANAFTNYRRVSDGQIHEQRFAAKET
jgi:hypothetical protein